MSETRKLAAILCSDVVGFSRLAGADEDRILARLRALRSDLIDPTIAVHNGRVVKRTGDGSIVEFRSVVDAVRCAIEVQNAMIERNAGVPEDRRIVFRIGIHLGDVVEESDGDLMGDGVNIAARLQGVAAPGAICLSEQAYWQVKGRLDLAVTDLGPTQLKNIAEPMRRLFAASRQAGGSEARQARRGHRARQAVHEAAARLGRRRRADRARGRRLALPRREPFRDRRAGALDRRAASEQSLRRRGPGLSRRRADRRTDDFHLASARHVRDRAQHRLHLQGQADRREGDRQGPRREIRAGRFGAADRDPHPRQRPTRRRGNRRASLGGEFRRGSRRPAANGGRYRHAARAHAGPAR